MKRKRRLVALSVVAVLVVLTAMAGYKVRPILRPPTSFTDLFHNELLAFHSRVAANFSGDEVVFLGDSHIQGLAVHRIAPGAVNFGVGSLQTTGIKTQLARMPNLASVEHLVIGIGFNDLRQTSQTDALANYQQLLAMVPYDTKITVLSVMPIDERFIRAASIVEPNELNNLILSFNQKLEDAVAQRPNTSFIDTYSWMLEDGRLPAQWHNTDGVHLSPAGYERLITLLNSTL